MSDDRLMAEFVAVKQQLQAIQEIASRRAERVLIFIDNTNLNFTCRKVESSGQYRLCYKKLTEHLTANRTLKQCRIYYSDFSREAVLSAEDAGRRQEREGFYGWLKWQGFLLKSCPLVERGDGTTKEKGLDAAITRDIERLANCGAADTIILVAGDADYKETLTEVQTLYGCRVEVAFFAEYTAKSLQYAATSFIDLTKVKESLRRTQPTT